MAYVTIDTMQTTALLAPAEPTRLAAAMAQRGAPLNAAKTRCNWVKPIVSVCNLRKVYRNDIYEKVAVKEVSFDVMPGQVLGIIGPEGAGKTTIVECIAGLRPADGGAIRVAGVDPQTDPITIRSLVTIQPKNAIRLATRYRAGLSSSDRGHLHIPMRPKVAIFDELTTGMDLAGRLEVAKLIERLRKAGMTVLLVTRYLAEAEQLCDQIVVINDGLVAARGSSESLIANTAGAETLTDVYETLTGVKAEVGSLAAADESAASSMPAPTAPNPVTRDQAANQVDSTMGTAVESEVAVNSMVVCA